MNIYKLLPNQTSLQERIDCLKKLSFEQFFRLIILGRKSFKIGDSSSMPSKSQHIQADRQGYIHVFGNEIYSGPSEPKKRLQEVYERRIQSLTEGNFQDFLLDIYVCITLGQVFDDGNGRTALFVYQFLQSGNIEDLENGFKKKKMGSHPLLSAHKQIMFGISQEGLRKLLVDKNAIDSTQKIATLNAGKQGEIDLVVKKNGKRVIGVNAYLMMLAFCDVFGFRYSDAIKIEINVDIIDTLKDNGEAKVLFEDNYRKYVELLFDYSRNYALDDASTIRYEISSNISDIIS